MSASEATQKAKPGNLLNLSYVQWHAEPEMKDGKAVFGPPLFDEKRRVRTWRNFK